MASLAAKGKLLICSALITASLHFGVGSAAPSAATEARAASGIRTASVSLSPGYQSSADRLTASIGWAPAERNPYAGSLSSFGSTGSFSLDSGLNSIGADLGAAHPFNLIELAADGSGTHRVEKADLSLYVSEDNVTYEKVSNWDFLKLDRSLLIYNFSETARYVKVHSHYDDTAAEYTGANLQAMMAIYELPAGTWTASGGGQWSYRKAVTVSNPNNETVYDRAVYLPDSSLGTSALIAAGRLQADYRDARFADATGRELSFYKDDDGFYVRLPDMATLASSTVYFYYGNPAAAFVGGGQEALQVEYGNKTLTPQGDDALEFGGNIKPVRLPDGTLMLMAQTDIDNGIYARYSFDDGMTWSAPEPLIAPGSRSGVSLDSPGGAYVDEATGDLFVVFYSYHYFGVWDGVHSCLDDTVCRSDLYVVKSTGYTGGKPSFGTPVAVTGMMSSLGHPVNYAVTYANPIRTSTGRLIVTFGFVIGDDGTFAGGVVYSDDNGLTWTKSASDLTIPSIGGEGGVSETAIIERADGSLIIYARQQRGDKTTLAQSVSLDNGTTWSAAQDSDILSSNTFPALSRDDDGSILLNWSGHNAMGGTSYQRNDLTVAYSRDETLTWNGYRNVLDRTSLSTPGWYSEGERRQAVESDKVPAGENAYLFSWSGGTRTGSLLVEDFDRYLYRSHGALDDFEYERAPGATDNGTRLAGDYWWKTTSFGSVTTSSAQARHGERSLRIYDHASNITPTGASRLFPAVRKGTAELSLYGASFANGINISLQEGYSQHPNAVGTAFRLHVAPDGALLYADTQEAYNRRAGFVPDDVNPAAGNLENVGNTAALALDYKNRSVGMDLGRVETITQIKLIDNDASNRLSSGNLAVYISNINDGDWQLVTGWTYSKAGGTITLGGLNAQARYVKVHQNYADTAYTFVNGLQEIIQVVSEPASRRIGYLTGDTNPATGNLGSWGTSGSFGFDYQSRSMGMDLGAPETINEIKLWDNDGSNRLTASDLSVYVSETNAGDWQAVTGWSFAKSNGNIKLGGMSVTARFVKVHQAYSDSSFTFVGDIRSLMTVQTAERAHTTGYLTGDANPLTGNLSSFGYTGTFALDYQNRSIGVDLGQVESVREITLRDSDSSNRIAAGDLEVYVSRTNNGDWVQATGWTFQKSNREIKLGGLSATARYVKVHQAYSDASFTFANELSNMMSVKTAPVASVLHALPVPTSLAANVWNDIRLSFDLAGGTAEVFVNGASKGIISAAHPGPVIAHLLIATEPGSGTDVYVDRFLLIDESVALPAAGSVGAEETL
ncbi:sialidase family protein [Cohnella sp. GbtcB17]|uniref:sialidase family protein n=1 Tax=Cohnella sp. GbtcB17 TaxID=2824762 RepID=UPI001C2F977A|nr:sialidase family protein [Cohnella sp. GbtcB17]